MLGKYIESLALISINFFLEASVMKGKCNLEICYTIPVVSFNND